jgi:hypothetical protein
MEVAGVGGRGGGRGGLRWWEEEVRGKDLGRAEVEEVATGGIGRSSRLPVRTHTHLPSIPDRTTNSRRGWQPLRRRHATITPLRSIPWDTR